MSAVKTTRIVTKLLMKSKNGVIIDQVGEDLDPGTAWDVGGVSNATKNHTLVRKASVTSGNIATSLFLGTVFFVISENSNFLFPEYAAAITP